MKKVNVLYISQEITPYLPENEQSVVARTLPQAIQEMGNEIRTFMPRFGGVNERRHQLHEVIRLSGMNLVVNDHDHPLIIKVASIQSARMQVYFIDNEEYFKRKETVVDANGAAFADNDERMIFFCRGVIETVKKLGWTPDVVHCNGWLTGLVPMYLKKCYADEPLFANAKVVYSLYDNEFEGSLNKDFYKKATQYDGLSADDAKVAKDPTFNNITKLAMQYSDGVVVGTENLGSEISKYLKKVETPVLAYQGAEGYAKAYDSFYHEVLESVTELVD